MEEGDEPTRVLPSDDGDDELKGQTKFEKYGIDVLIGMLFVFFGIYVPWALFNDEHALNKEIPGYYETLSFSGLADDVNGTILNYTSVVYIQNPSNMRSFAYETAVPGSLLFVLDAVVPLTFVFLLSYVWLFKILHWNGKYLYYEFVSFFYAYLTGMSLTFWLTRFVKYYCSWQRPDFWGRCNPQFSFSTNITYDSIQTFDGCHYKDDPDLSDSDWEKAFTSFVSGHTSYMFTAAIVLTYWTYGKLKHPSITREQRLSMKFKSDNNIFIRFIGQRVNTNDMYLIDNKYKYVIDYSWIVGFILSTWGLWGSMFVAISRIDDHRHFPSDLVGGALLAFCNATFGFLTQYDYAQPFSKRVLRIMENDEKKVLKNCLK